MASPPSAKKRVEPTRRGEIAGVPLTIVCHDERCASAVEELALYFDRELLQDESCRGAAPLSVELSAGPLSAEPEALLSFTHGLVRAFHADGALRLRSPGCDVQLDAQAQSMRCLLDVGGMEQIERTVHVTLFIAIALMLRARGRFHLHAASLRAPDDAGLLVVGDGGAGKTTLALALTRAGLTLMGDDACWLQVDEEGIVAHPAQRPIQADERVLAAIPGASELTRRKLPGSDKFRVSLPRGGGALCPRWLLFPRVVERPRSELCPLDAPSAFGALLRASALLLAEGALQREANVHALGALLDRCQSLEVAMGRDVLDATDKLAWAQALWR